VRSLAASALGRLREEAAVEPLLTALRALEAAGRTAPTPFRMTSDFDPADHIWSNIFQALRSITGRYFGEDRVAWEEWWQAHKAAAAH
jgi:HEAT repeat protein